MHYIFDIAIVLILAFFAWRGAVKGLILTLCGLVSIFVAFFGARFLSGQFYQPVSNIIEPAILQSVKGVEPGAAGQTNSSALTVDDLLDAVHEAGLFAGFTSFLDQAAQENAIPDSGSRTAAEALANYLSKLIARAVLFAAIFLVILLAWFLISHALDLTFHLPILSSVNLAGGLIIGLVKAVLLVIVLVWLGQLAGWIPSEPDTPLVSLFTVRRLGELLARIPV